MGDAVSNHRKQKKCERSENGKSIRRRNEEEGTTGAKGRQGPPGGIGAGGGDEAVGPAAQGAGQRAAVGGEGEVGPGAILGVPWAFQGPREGNNGRGS